FRRFRLGGLDDDANPVFVPGLGLVLACHGSTWCSLESTIWAVIGSKARADRNRRNRYHGALAYITPAARTINDLPQFDHARRAARPDRRQHRGPRRAIPDRGGAGSRAPRFQPA